MSRLTHVPNNPKCNLKGNKKNTLLLNGASNKFQQPAHLPNDEFEQSNSSNLIIYFYANGTIIAC